MIRVVALLSLLLASAAGCTYLGERGRDFLDCFKLAHTGGLGAGAKVRVGPVGFGVGAWSGAGIGLERKGDLRCWREKFLGFPLGGFLSKRYSTKGWVPYGTTCCTVQNWDDPVGGESEFASGSAGIAFSGFSHDDDTVTWRVLGRKRATWTEQFWVEGSVHCLLGVRAGFNAAEFLDFLLGWFGLDIARDDREYASPRLSPARPPTSAKPFDPDGDGEGK